RPIHVELRRVGIGVVGAELLEEASIARVAGIGRHDAVKGVLLGAGASQPDLDGHDENASDVRPADNTKAERGAKGSGRCQHGQAPCVTKRTGQPSAAVRKLSCRAAGPTGAGRSGATKSAD